MAYGAAQPQQPAPQAPAGGAQGAQGAGAGQEPGALSLSSAPPPAGGGGSSSGFAAGRGGGAGLPGAAGAAHGGGAKEPAGHAPPAAASYSDVLAAYSQPYSQLRPLQYLPELGRVGYYPYQTTSTEFPGYHGYGPAALEASPHKLVPPVASAALAPAGFSNRPSEGGASPTCAASIADTRTPQDGAGAGGYPPRGVGSSGVSGAGGHGDASGGATPEDVLAPSKLDGAYHCLGSCVC
ncbi:Inactive phospholipase C-like protein 1 [Frankliniella fusca]|uniref:Inactive phospholipase C-like protein 1 n=1 Tax=Frankliniella fusca TaxID=407009 RepID=A0AAE1HIQ7_9NEOP|nr:Inactive phospholipase C-like protein 1 [Frankliniella fusca]